MTFRQFLKTIKDEDSPRGDFAKDFLNDRRISAGMVRSYEGRWHLLELYLKTRKACLEAIQAAKSCFNEWMATK